jgi:hypothetical protein
MEPFKWLNKLRLKIIIHKKMRNKVLLFAFFLLIVIWADARTKQSQETKYASYKGLVMCGYQGWHNTPTDGSERGWTHLGKRGVFASGSCNIDLWPDVSEYIKTYKTDFKLADSTYAYVYSSADESTTDLHFSWMKKYGIDGVFMQRFVGEIKRDRGKFHFDKVLSQAMIAAKKYDRAICVMYDLSGMRPGDEEVLLKDMDELTAKYNLFSSKVCPTYLHHNGKPLVTVWGVGFNDGRAYGLKEAEIIINVLKSKGFSVMLGVPTFWRDFGNDTDKDPKLHDLIKKCDIVMPWFVGRYNEASFETFKSLVPKDIEWCKTNKVDYAPLVFPGFSWRNMNGPKATQIPRNKGSFLWKQVVNAVEAGAEMLYVAMFDEIDEGTAIYKVTNNPPVGASPFVTYEGLPSDFYLWLTGKAGQMLRKEIPLQSTIPVYPSK